MIGNFAEARIERGIFGMFEHSRGSSRVPLPLTRIFGIFASWDLRRGPIPVWGSSGCSNLRDHRGPRAVEIFEMFEIFECRVPGSPGLGVSIVLRAAFCSGWSGARSRTLVIERVKMFCEVAPGGAKEFHDFKNETRIRTGRLDAIRVSARRCAGDRGDRRLNAIVTRSGALAGCA